MRGVSAAPNALLGGWKVPRVRFAFCSWIEMTVDMTVGETPKPADLWRGSASVIGDQVAPDSIWRVSA